MIAVSRELRNGQRESRGFQGARPVSLIEHSHLRGPGRGQLNGVLQVV